MSLSRLGSIATAGRLALAASTVCAALTLATPIASAQTAPPAGRWSMPNGFQEPRYSKVRVFEVSVDPGVYERGHIPGAVNINWHSDLVDPVKRDIVAPAAFEALLEKAGVDKTPPSSSMATTNNWFAAWGGWVFNQYRPRRAREAARWRPQILGECRRFRSIPRRRATPRPTSPCPRPSLSCAPRLVNVLEVVDGKKDAVIVDIRSPDEYSGKLFAPEGSKELSIRAGHVPGAKNLPWSKAVDAETGKFKSKEELKKLYADAASTAPSRVIVYCRIGERSSHTWYALSRILGFEVKNYDGSWTEYGNSIGVPVINLAGTVWTGQVNRPPDDGRLAPPSSFPARGSHPAPFSCRTRSSAGPPDSVMPPPMHLALPSRLLPISLPS